MARLTAEAYIDLTYRIIATEGIEAVTIRYLAEKLECSTATLYRHFDSLEQLIVFASLRFLKPYVEEIAGLGRAKYTLDTYYKVWDIFMRYSCENPQIFNYVFFNRYKEIHMIHNAVNQYYEANSDDVDALQESLRPIFTGDDLFLRSSNFLKYCLGKEEDSKKLIETASDSITYMYKGILQSQLEDADFDVHKARIQFHEAMKMICKGFI